MKEKVIFYVGKASRIGQKKSYFTWIIGLKSHNSGGKIPVFG